MTYITFEILTRGRMRLNVLCLNALRLNFVLLTTKNSITIVWCEIRVSGFLL